jgi:Mrp family chromosome partitioning ATPase
LGTFRSGADDAERGADWWVIQHAVTAHLKRPDADPSRGGAIAGVVAVASVAKGAPDAAAAAAELGAAFARNGTRVLLVAMDGSGIADNATEEAVCAGSPAVGLAGVLAGKSSLADAIQSANDGRLNFLDGPGPDNPIPILQSEKFRQLFDELRAAYPLIIVYSSDFFGHMEATLLKDMVAYAVLTLSGKSTERRKLSSAVQLLATWNVKLVGTILNSGSPDLDLRIQRLTSVESTRGDSA